MHEYIDTFWGFVFAADFCNIILNNISKTTDNSLNDHRRVSDNIINSGSPKTPILLMSERPNCLQECVRYNIMKRTIHLSF